MTTAVPSIQFTATGPVLPSSSQILAGVQADINTAFGGGVNPLLSTPQGQLAQSIAAIIADKNAQIALIASEVNPDTADTRWQDAIGQIYFLQRIQATGTVVSLTINGLAGTAVPVGTLFQDTAGQTYSLTAPVTIASTGTVIGQVQNTVPGPTPCPTGTLTTIYTSVPGLETVTNAAAGSLGNLVESRSAFELRRRASVAANGVNSPQSLLGAVLSVSGVIGAFVVDNPSGTAITYGATNYSIPAHSVVVSVAGGTATQVAQAIWSKKPAGCGYAGNTTATVYDTSPQYAPTYPGYSVTWLTPTAQPIYISVSIARNNALPGNIVALVQAAITAAFNGTDGGIPAKIGGTLYAGRFYAGVTATNVNVSILSLFVGAAASPTTTSVASGIDQLPTLSSTNIVVTLV